MSASATGEAIATPPELRTLPVILIRVLGTATVGVTVARVTVRGWVGATMGVLTGTTATAVEALAARIGESGSTEIARSGIASRVAELVRRRPCPRILRPVTSRPPGVPRRLGLSAAHWGR